MSNDREFDYSRSDFIDIRAHLQKLTGIRLADSKDAMVYSRLVRRIRTLKLTSFKAYLAYLEANVSESEHFINSLTTNLTSFFREPHHFSVLAKFVRENPAVKTIWCAASSTGEEPYSIAMVLAEVFGRFDVPVKIIASDIDSQVLKSAQEAVYPITRIQGLDDVRRKSFFYRGKGSQEGFVKVVPELVRMVDFRKVNLLDDRWDISGPLDIIFCRNVMIYFDKNTQLNVLRRMVGLMKSEGIYIAGHSENFSLAKDLVVPLGQTVYRPALGVQRG